MMLRSLMQQDLEGFELEIIVADGMSDDNTANIVRGLSKEFPLIHLVENPAKVVPHALNAAIKMSTGEIIVRMDAHSEYPQNYIKRLVEVLLAENADNTGGVWDTQPGADTSMAKSIVFATSSKFGIGNAEYRLEGEGIVEVDTVPFGCYKREVFNRIGLFDEDMIRNQDDELNARLTKAGGKILLVRDVRIKYFARPTLKKLNKMFYQYGLFKPLVAKKVGQPATWRQFVPLAFVLFNIVGLIAGLVDSRIWTVLLVANAFHLFVGTMLGMNYAAKSNNSNGFWQVPAIIYCMHWYYGMGYLVGFIRFIILGIKPNVIAPSR